MKYLLLLIAAISALICTSSVLKAADQAISTASLLREETDLSRLPLHRDWSTHLDSSYDRTGGNKDYQQFLSKEGDTALLADLKGPGALVRIWSTAVAKVGNGLSSTPTGQLKIYIDDNPTPVINLPFGDLFKGKFAPFMPPLTMVNASANYTYLPIPYAKHCRVTVDKPDELFYQIDSVHFPKGTKVRPFALPLTAEDRVALDKAATAWTPLPPPTPIPTAVNPPLALASGSTGELPILTGPATIKSILFYAPNVTDAALRKLILRIWFDGHKTPDIEAPVADFFGNAYGHKVFNSIPFSQDASGKMFFQLPMPFSVNARISIENGNAVPATLEYFLNVDHSPIPPGSLYLHADFNQEISVLGKPHPWAHVEGHTGHFGVVVQVMQSARTLGFCEGDDQVRVDDEKFIPSTQFTTVIAPSNGTGTEDCFNSAWYYSEGVKALPVSGCLVRQDFGRIDTFRFFFNDAPVFQHSLDAQIETGATNDGPGIYYSSLAFWYGDGERTPLMPMPAASTLGFPKVTFTGFPIVIEGESLVPSAKASSGAVQVKDMSGRQHAWSGNAELAWTGVKRGDTLTLTFDAPTARSYQLFMMLHQGPDHGGFKFTVNGQPLSHDFDAYDTETRNQGPVEFGVVNLPTGPSQLTITQTGQRTATGDFGLDFIGLRPYDKPKTP